MTPSIPPPRGFLATIEQALHMLGSVTTLSEVIDFRNQAEALRVLAQRSRYGLAAQNACAEIRIRAELKIGLLLDTMDRQRVGRPQLVARGDYYGVPRLRDLGITKSISYRARRLVDIPTELFETYIADVKTKNQELTTRSLVLLGERTVAREHNRQRVVGGHVDDLIEFAGRVKCGTILLDPPWRSEGSPVLPYLTSSVDEIKRLPIPALAASRCHLFLWTLPNWTLWTAKDLMEYWGFRITGVFTWCKSGGPGRGQYFRHATEHLVIGVCGRADRFDDHSFNSYRVEPRQDHSRKPDCFFEMIEATSPPPRVELFSRKKRPGWHCWGHEIETPLMDQIGTSM